MQKDVTRSGPVVAVSPLAVHVLQERLALLRALGNKSSEVSKSRDGRLELAIKAIVEFKELYVRF